MSLSLLLAWRGWWHIIWWTHLRWSTLYTIILYSTYCIEYKMWMKWNTESLLKCQVPKLFSLRWYHVLRKMAIFLISLICAQQCIILWWWLLPIICSIFVVFVGRIYLQHFNNEWNPYSFANMIASNNSIKLISTGTGTCHSTLALTTQVNTENECLGPEVEEGSQIRWG